MRDNYQYTTICHYDQFGGLPLNVWWNQTFTATVTPGGFFRLNCSLCIKKIVYSKFQIIFVTNNIHWLEWNDS